MVPVQLAKRDAKQAGYVACAKAVAKCLGHGHRASIWSDYASIGLPAFRYNRLYLDFPPPLPPTSGLSRTYYDGLMGRCLEHVSSRTGSDKGDEAKGI